MTAAENRLRIAAERGSAAKDRKWPHMINCSADLLYAARYGIRSTSPEQERRRNRSKAT